MTQVSHTLLWLTIALAFWLLNVVLHLEFSNWIVVSYATPFGAFVPRDHTHAIAILVCLVFTVFLFRQWRHGNNRTVTLAGWIVAFTAMVASMFLITTTVVEMIHFLQYGLLAYLLALALDRHREQWPLLTLMFLVTFLGILDELNQYFYLTQNNSTYIDFNDFVLNQVGACAGLLAWYGFRPMPAIRKKQRLLPSITASGYALLGLVTLVLAMTGHLRYTPQQTVPPGGIDIIDGNWVIFFQREPDLLSNSLPTFTTGQYFVMGLLEGFLVIMLITLLMKAFVVFSEMSNTTAQ